MIGRRQVKICIDACMTVLLAFMMAYNVTGNLAHEILGTTLFSLFAAHVVLNRRWYRVAVRGTKDVAGFIHFAVNVALAFAMVGMAVTAIMVSRDLFAFLGIDSGSEGRKWHVFSCSWGFMLMGIHLGFHLRAISVPLIQGMGPMRNGTKKLVLRILAACISSYGAWMFVHDDFTSKLALRSLFSFYDPQKAAFSYFVDYLSVLGLCAFITHYALRLSRLTVNSK